MPTSILIDPYRFNQPSPDYMWTVLYIAAEGTSATEGGMRGRVQTLSDGNSRHIHTNVPMTGKHYIEFAPFGQTAAFPNFIGIASAINNSALYQAGNWGHNAFAGCGLSGPGYVHNGATTGTGGSLAYPDLIGFAVDVPNLKMWVRRNGVWTGDPVAGTGNTFTLVGTSFYWKCATYSCFAPGAHYALWDIHPNAGTQVHAAPTGYSPYQPTV